MDISKNWGRWFRKLWRTPVDLDNRVLDGWIHDALIDEATAVPPAGAWDRLRDTIRDRRPIKRYGMWVLDEPLRDPPGSSLSMLYHNDSQRLDRNPHFNFPHYNFRGVLWSSLPPSFVAVANW